MNVPLLIPQDRLRLNAALDWFHTGHSDHAGFDWIAERVRRDHPVRTALASGTLKAWLLTEKGYQILVPLELWTGQFLWQEAYSTALVTARIGDRAVTGYLVVDIDAFMALVSAGDASAMPRHAPSPPVYVPPYLVYMLELVERLDLTKDYKYNKETLTDWILKDEHVRSQNLPMSLNKAKLISTFLGNPDFEEGGNTAAGLINRNPDPLKPFNGISFPKPRRRP